MCNDVRHVGLSRPHCRALLRGVGTLVAIHTRRHVSKACHEGNLDPEQCGSAAP